VFRPAPTSKSPRRILATLHEERSAGALRREVRYELDGKTHVLWWEFDGAPLPSPLKRSDLAVATLIYRAMHEGADLHVAGPVSKELLDRIDQFQDIWAIWRPDLYRKVAVTADAEVDTVRRSPARMASAVCAFSGGVDGTATTWRHFSGQAGRMTRKLHAGVLIWGFDIKLDDAEGWAIASATAAVMLADIDVPLVRVRTNWKNEACVAYEMEFAAGVLGCLWHWDEDVATLLLGSCEEYNRLVTPWGSHPLTTQLLAAQDSASIYDAGAMTRTAKVKLIAEWPVGYDNLRVCWRGFAKGQNCGVCEKCIRTKLNAIVSGVRIPASLERPPAAREILALRGYHHAAREFFEEILEAAAANGIAGPLIDATRLNLRNTANPPLLWRLDAFIRPRVPQQIKSLARRFFPNLRRATG